jgi:hypothetical protein
VSGRLLSGQFVAVFPALVRALGSMEAAAVLQYVAYKQDGDSPVRLAVSTIAEETGMTERSARRYTQLLADLGVLGKQQPTPGGPLAYTVRRDHPILAAAERETPGQSGQGSGPTPGQSGRGGAAPLAATATNADDDGQGMLVDVPTPDREPTGHDLFVAFCDGYAERFGRQPDPAVRGPLLGMVKRVTTTRTDRPSWVAAWHAFVAAGRDGRPGRVMDHLMGTHRPTAPAWRANHDLDRLADRMTPYAAPVPGTSTALAMLTASDPPTARSHP